ncbi:MAG TPA: hypothetical protein VLJ62_30200, partial [Burkholderiaceae bacterium]|nr:hypothetical protein [Burkholderiaceae bacterium]
MAAPDRAFAQTYAWYRASIDRLVAAAPIAPAQQSAVARVLWQMAGVLNADAPPISPDLNDFRDNGAAAESLAIACEVIGEVLVAIGHVRQAIAAVDGGGNPAAALSVLGSVMQQIDRLTQLQAGSRYPSAFSIGKMLLMLSGDLDANPAAGHEADNLAALLGAAGATQIADRQAALGSVALLVGSMLDRSFTAPSGNAAAGFIAQALPSFAGMPTLTLPGPPGLIGTLAFDAGPPAAVKASLGLALGKSAAIGGANIALAIKTEGGFDVVVPVLPPASVQVSDASYTIGVEIKRTGNALTIGSDARLVKLEAHELGIALALANGKPALQFFARGTKASISPPDGFMKLILGQRISVGMDIAAQADAAGKLRLINGTGLHASLPVPSLPTGPFELQLIHLGLEPEGGSFSKLAVEISASFGVQLGPFAASVDRLGLLLKFNLGGGTPVAFDFKPPNGIGLVLDAG